MHLTNSYSRKHILLVIVIVLALGVMAIPAFAKGDKAPGDATIYEIAKGSEDFETLAFALEATGLDAALDGPEVANSLDDISGSRLAFGSDHGRAFADAAERFTEVPAAADERHPKRVL